MTSGFYCSQPADSAEQRSCPRGRRKVKRKPLWSWIQLSLEPGQQRLFSSLFLSLFHLPLHVQINVTSHRSSVTKQIGCSARPHATRCQNLCARCRQQRAQAFYYFNTIFVLLMDRNNSTTYIFLQQRKSTPAIIKAECSTGESVSFVVKLVRVDGYVSDGVSS